MANARAVAIKALTAVENDGGYSNIVLDKALRSASLSAADSAFASALFYGVLDRKYTLDFYIGKYCSRPINKLSPFVLQALRTAIYQLEYMDKVPSFAAINETVNAVKHSKDKYASGLVNAVLRSFLRDENRTLPDGDKPSDLAIRYSCEEWLAKKYIEDYGIDEAKRILESALETPSTYLRINTTKAPVQEVKEALENEGAEVEKTQLKNCLRLKKGSVEQTKAYANGLFHVQDLSSQMCCEALQVENGMRVLDICAAPGGKTFTLSELMSGTGEVVSCDIHAHRVELIRKGAERLDLHNITAAQNDATKFNASLGTFDRILCDVPCSGTGVIRRKPDIKYKPKFDIEQLTQLQLEILETASTYLKSGGRLVYSTCTLIKDENTAVVERFLANNSDFSLDKEPVTLMPYGETDGFFYCSLVKRK